MPEFETSDWGAVGMEGWYYSEGMGFEATIMKHPISAPSVAPLLITSVMFCGEVPASLAQGAPNLLVNGSFETVDGPSLAGWQPGNPELASFVSPGAPGEGDWALRLEADWAPTLGYVTQKVEGLRDGDIIEVRAEVKAMGQYGGGELLLFVGDSPGSKPTKSARSLSESWTTLSVVDTLELADGDSVWVRLSSFHTEIVPLVGLFDSASLTVLGSVPVVPVTWGSLKARYH